MAHIIIPDVKGSSCRAWAKGSTARANKNGDRGHPCRVALDREIDGEKFPLILNCAIGAE